MQVSLLTHLSPINTDPSGQKQPSVGVFKHIDPLPFIKPSPIMSPGLNWLRPHCSKHPVRQAAYSIESEHDMATHGKCEIQVFDTSIPITSRTQSYQCHKMLLILLMQHFPVKKRIYSKKLCGERFDFVHLENKCLDIISLQCHIFPHV